MISFDLGQVSTPRTIVHSPQFLPYVPGVSKDPAFVGRGSEINGFMPKGRFGQFVHCIYIHL